jgi:hypothetical protein
VAQRVRARTGDLLDGAFSGDQIADELSLTAENHREALAALDLPARVAAMFDEEGERVTRAVQAADRSMLAILPGKHLLSLLTSVLGQSNAGVLTGLLTSALDRRYLKSDDSLRLLGQKLETALLAYLPPRRAVSSAES